jgi:membrane associated rhomboid family serine protease
MFKNIKKMMNNVTGTIVPIFVLVGILLGIFSPFLELQRES